MRAQRAADGAGGSRVLLVLHQLGHIGVRLRRPRGSARRPFRRVIARRGGGLLQSVAVHVDRLQARFASCSHRPGRGEASPAISWGRAWHLIQASVEQSGRCGARARRGRVTLAAPTGQPASRPHPSASGRRLRAGPRADAQPRPQCRAVGGRGPPREAALRDPLVAEPGNPWPSYMSSFTAVALRFPEDEDGSGERVVLEGLLAKWAGRPSRDENRRAGPQRGSSSGA